LAPGLTKSEATEADA